MEKEIKKIIDDLNLFVDHEIGDVVLSKKTLMLYLGKGFYKFENSYLMNDIKVSEEEVINFFRQKLRSDKINKILD
jgi:hypothetical protein